MDTPLKERLVGASVLVFLGVLLIPMLLSGPGNRPVKQPVSLPDSDAMQTVRIPLKDKPATVDDTAAAPAEVEVVAAGAEQPAVEPEPEVKRTGDEAAAHDTTPADGNPVTAPRVDSAPELATDTPTGAWTVQVGSFSQPGNAEALAGKLQALDYPAFVQRFNDGTRMHYRVRIGGFADREAAAAKAAEVKERTGEPARPAMND